MTTPERLTQGLQLLDALHQVQGQPPVAETPETLQARLAELCAHQALPVTEEHMSQAVALYQQRQGTPTPPSSRPAPSAFASGYAFVGRSVAWSLVSGMCVGMGLFAVMDGIHGVVAHYALGGIVLDFLVGGASALGAGWAWRRGRAPLPGDIPRASLPRSPTLAQRLRTILTAPATASSEGADTATKKLPPVLAWDQGDWRHPMETQAFRWARRSSRDAFKLATPYEGKQRMSLQVVEDPAHGRVAVALLLPKGQYAVASQIRVRFGEGESQYWAVDENDSTVPPPLRSVFLDKTPGKPLFLQEAALFVAQMAAHDQVTVEVGFHHNGTRVMGFSTEAFPLAVDPRWQARAARTLPPSSTGWTVRPATPSGITQRELASTMTAWVDEPYKARFIRLECHVRRDAARKVAQVGFFLGDCSLYDTDHVDVQIADQAPIRVEVRAQPADLGRTDFLTQDRRREGHYVWLTQGQALRDTLKAGMAFTVTLRVRHQGRLSFQFHPTEVPAAELGLAPSPSKPSAPAPEWWFKTFSEGTHPR